MNKLGEFVQAQMDARQWRQRDLARESGLSRQLVSQLLRQDRLQRMIEPATVAGLARAFRLPEAAILAKAAEAVGVPSGLILTAEDLPDEQLLEILLRRRLAARAGSEINGADQGVATNPDHRSVTYDDVSHVSDPAEGRVSGRSGGPGGGRSRTTLTRSSHVPRELPGRLDGSQSQPVRR